MLTIQRERKKPSKCHDHANVYSHLCELKMEFQHHVILHRSVELWETGCRSLLCLLWENLVEQQLSCLIVNVNMEEESTAIDANLFTVCGTDDDYHQASVQTSVVVVMSWTFSVRGALNQLFYSFTWVHLPNCKHPKRSRSQDDLIREWSSWSAISLRPSSGTSTEQINAKINPDAYVFVLRDIPLVLHRSTTCATHGSYRRLSRLICPLCLWWWLFTCGLQLYLYLMIAYLCDPFWEGGSKNEKKKESPGLFDDVIDLCHGLFITGICGCQVFNEHHGCSAVTYWNIHLSVSGQRWAFIASVHHCESLRQKITPFSILSVLYNIMKCLEGPLCGEHNKTKWAAD